MSDLEAVRWVGAGDVRVDARVLSLSMVSECRQAVPVVCPGVYPLEAGKGRRGVESGGRVSEQDRRSRTLREESLFMDHCPECVTQELHVIIDGLSFKVFKFSVQCVNVCTE